MHLFQSIKDSIMLLLNIVTLLSTGNSLECGSYRHDWLIKAWDNKAEDSQAWDPVDH